MSQREPASVAIAKMLDQSGYLQDLREERSEEAEGRIENLAELVSAAREYEGREPEPSLAGFVDRLSLLSEADESEGAEDARVLLMTLHAAKGLEFPAVIIAGLEEGLFPHSRSADDDETLEEERRLCYVGMTRARRQLVPDQRRPAPRVRRVPRDRAVALPRRDSRRSSCSATTSSGTARLGTAASARIRGDRDAASSGRRGAGAYAVAATATARVDARRRPARAEASRRTPPEDEDQSAHASGCGWGCGCGTRSSASARSSGSRTMATM